MDPRFFPYKNFPASSTSSALRRRAPAIENLPIEILEKIFSHLYEPAANATINGYAFSTGALLINRKYGFEASSALGNTCNIVAVRLELTNVLLFLQRMRIRFASTNHTRVQAFIASGRCRMELTIGTPGAGTFNPNTFHGLIPASGFADLCDALRWYFYGRTIALFQWPRITNQSGNIFIGQPTTQAPRYAMTIRWGAAYLREMDTTAERQIFAALGKVIVPGMSVLLANAHRAPRMSIANLAQTVAPSMVSATAMAWDVHSMMKDIYTDLVELFHAGDLAALEGRLDAISDAWGNGILTHLFDAYDDEPFLQQHILRPIAFSRAILMDCLLLLYCLRMVRGFYDQAGQLIQTLQHDHHTLLGMANVRSCGVTHAILPGSDSHVDLMRCSMLHWITTLPTKPGRHKAPGELQAELEGAMDAFASMVAVVPDRAVVARELAFLRKIDEDDQMFRAWSEGEMARADVVAGFEFGLGGDVPSTSAACAAVPPTAIHGWF